MKHKTEKRILDYSHLKAVFVNCTLKKSPEISHTKGLMSVSEKIMRSQGVSVKTIRAIDYDIATGVFPDMTQKGWDNDDWPKIFQEIMEADILVLGSPIWLGEKSSICQKVIERLYSQSAELNEKGQYIYYGRVGGCIITGNEDGVKHCAMGILYSLQHLGFTIPPQADAGWIGDVGPGPSYLDKNSGGPQNEFTQRNTAFMTWNLMHMAAILKEFKGVPAYGNQENKWNLKLDKDNQNPEYRS